MGYPMPEEILTSENYDYRFPDHWIAESDGTGLWSITHKAYVGRAVEIVQESGASRVVEVGCGDGWNCGKLIQAGFDVVGVDWSKNGIDYARRFVPDAEFYCGDIADTEFLGRFPGQFDAGLFIEVLEHIPISQCADVLRNIAGLLKEEGCLVLTTPSVNLPNTNPQHYQHFSEKSLRSVIDDSGCFEIKSIEGYGDLDAASRHYQIARIINNRYYTIHPLYKWLCSKYHKHTIGIPLNRCRGFIVTMTRRS
jgi:SAM-dependent methyltransferase